jgi:hypothetical protein
MAQLTERKHMKKNNRPRLSSRDVVLVTWIAQQSVCRLDTLAMVCRNKNFEATDRTLRRQTERWVQLGLIEKDRLLANCPSILWTTNEGLKLANFEIKKGERNYKPSFSTLHHNLAVARVRIEYEKGGAFWTCERELRKQLTGKHLADGLADYDGQKILVEIDRTLKTSSRIQRIMTLNAKTPGISIVDYWVTNELYVVFQKIILELDKDISSKIRLFILPSEVAV